MFVYSDMKKHALKVALHVAAPGAESVVYDCLVRCCDTLCTSGFMQITGSNGGMSISLWRVTSLCHRSQNNAPAVS